MIIDKRKNEIMRENLNWQGEELGDSYPTQEWFLGESSRVIWAAFPPLTGKNLQKTASKGLLEMLQNTPKMSKKFLFLHKFFYIKILNKKLIFLTYLWVLETEIQMEMMQQIKWNKKARSVRRFQG